MYIQSAFSSSYLRNLKWKPQVQVVFFQFCNNTWREEGLDVGDSQAYVQDDMPFGITVRVTSTAL